MVERELTKLMVEAHTTYQPSIGTRNTRRVHPGSLRLPHSDVSPIRPSVGLVSVD